MSNLVPFRVGQGHDLHALVADRPLIIGGVLGAVYVAVFTLLIPRVGAAAAICLAVLGQVVASLLLDHYGVLQAQRPADWTRITGAVLVLLGVLLVAAPWKAPPAAL